MHLHSDVLESFVEVNIVIERKDLIWCVSDVPIHLVRGLVSKLVLEDYLENLYESAIALVDIRVVIPHKENFSPHA